MARRLLVGILSHQSAGKSTTWKMLFERVVATGTRERKLWLSKTEWVNVFLVNGSPEEREIYVGEIIKPESPSIVLCSMQYISDVTQTINYFAEREYHLFIHWLNPGYKDHSQSEDYLNLIPYIHQLDGDLEIRNGQEDSTLRVNEIRDFIHRWASTRHLLNSISQITFNLGYKIPEKESHYS